MVALGVLMANTAPQGSGGDVASEFGSTSVWQGDPDDLPQAGVGGKNSKRIVYLLGGVILTSCLVGAGAYFYFTSPRPETRAHIEPPPQSAIPVMARGAVEPPVKSVDEPYPLPVGGPARAVVDASAGTDAPAIPSVGPVSTRVAAETELQEQVAKAQAQGDSAIKPMSVKAAPARSSDKVQDAPKAKDTEKKGPVESLVVDEEVGAAKAQQGRGRVVDPIPTKITGGLVAMGPDGKSALFTNPRTRIPTKFVVGEKLPNGETIKSIDKANGKVVTDVKEYQLE